MNDWTNIWDMLVDIRKHARDNGRDIVKADIPEELRCGYKCNVTGKTWTIRIADVKRNGNTLNSELPSDIRDQYRAALSSEEGLELFMKMINGLE